jgi:chemotaxis protein methyltransferase CheR
MESSLFQFSGNFELKDKMDNAILTEEEFNKFSDFIHELTGIFLKDTKITLLSNRLRKRLKETGIDTFSGYYGHVASGRDEKEIEEMINAVSTNETYFFRSMKHYDALIDVIIPEMMERPGLPITVWSAGCASGEEAYTLAMLLDKKGLLEKRIIDIFASDINTYVINEAKRGLYDSKRLRSAPQEYIDRYFTKCGKNQYLLDQKIINSVNFSRINLKKDEFKRKYDIILCRNVMIYFDRDDQKNVVDKFYNAINNNGYFIIGHSEMLYYINDFFKYKKLADAPVYYKE